ncbi:TPA: DUF1889 family protein [Escherichia coli]|uniref:DUF1889 family protein n=1 Tax=Escherichia TaxID=561 RepID=UPI000CF70654|nr:MULTISPECIES: DUF1889 family protein [Escherichia]EFG9412608.1 DUF1889 family protein [Escherichia coli]EFI9564268.1 DUF1889 family protein [Escherichia coli]EHR9157665.1 DUF1889 family protein [Escherichia coli]PXA40416.1 DUF1889 domain-containing protein [Escherichia coli]HBM9793210.1 DUF1889 family protein [Escherichia albertii]
MNKALERALEYLSVVINTSTGLAHPLDESTAKELFKYLHELGIALEYSEIHQWAQKQGWENRHCNELASLAERISSGGRVVVKHKGRLNENLKKELLSLK